VISHPMCDVVLNTISNALLRAPACACSTENVPVRLATAVRGVSLLSTRWRGSLQVCRRSTTEEPHAAVVQPLLVRLPDG
jgi:hypothetical protein